MRWPLIVVAFAIGALAVAWVVAGRPQQQPATIPAASATPALALATRVAPSPDRSARVSAALTPAVTIASPTGAPATVAATVAATPRATPPATPLATGRPAPRPTPQPTEPPPGGSPGLAIVFPSDGEVVHDRAFNVAGTGPPGGTVTRDVPLWFDDHVLVREDGNWLMPVTLGEGENVLRFRVGDDRSTERVVTVTYQPRG
ncbi:MAG: Glucodextranase, domain [Chloroflexota bacterium]|nr:Glucodextranase, domain [Chloroflexota bacterium]